MKKRAEQILYKGKWISLKETTYTGKNGEELKWESIERTNTTNTVVIISKLLPSNKYLFIKQYRPAIDKYVLGFPAGLVEGENVEENALRELKEETGYTAKIKSISPLLHSNAALLSDTVRVVIAEIDETLSENIKPRQQLEPEEDIEVILVDRSEIKEFLLSEQEKGTAIGMGPWYAFCGLNNI